MALGLIGQYSILMRSSVIETLQRGLRHDGPGEGPDATRGSCARHALPNALLPTVTSSRINLGYVVAGAITVEVVFNWPGLGTLTVEALDGARLPGPAGHLPAPVASSVVLANLVADLVYGRLDPRVRT